MFSDTIFDFPYLFNADAFLNATNKTTISSEIKTDIVKNEDSYQFNLYLAGFNKEDIKIDFEDSHLIVSGNRTKDESINYQKTEGYFGSFEKKWKLSEKLDGDNISAEFINGILSIKIPLIKTEKRKIEIK